MYNPFTLEGKSILVTGASSGIGRAIAIECSKMGAQIIISARNEERLKETMSNMEGDGHTFHIANLEIEEERDNLIDSLPFLDGLVNCAGFTQPKVFHFINSEIIDKIMNINFYAPVLLSSKLIKKKKISRNSSIVFISSAAGGFYIDIGNSIYSASKAAVNTIIKNMALELANKGIRVNSVCPGMTETPMIHDGTFTLEQLDEDKKRYPLKRYGKPEEIAYPVIYLLSNASSWVTGTNIIIDGGLTI